MQFKTYAAKFSRPGFFAFLTAAIIITILAMFSYVAVQQDLRQTANDPQIQIAEDAADSISSGEALPYEMPTSTRADLSKTLVTVAMIFDDAGNPVYTSAQLDGGTPIPPKGVFEATRNKGENRITWQPKPGVRLAAVVTRIGRGSHTGFVLIARSLREVEKREAAIGQLFIIAWAASIIVLIAGSVAIAWKRKGRVE
jgi:hypothetical protein